MHLSQRRGISYISFIVLIPVVLFCLLIFPSVTFCAVWEPIGPEGGCFIFSMTNPSNADEVTAITFSPSPSNVYRSADGGTSWSKIGEILDPYIYDVSAFDFSILYAITSSGCYSSTDGGISWSGAGLPPWSGTAYRICAHPTDSRIVYATGRYHTSQNTYTLVFFKSTDGGQSWSASQFFSFEGLAPYDMAISKSNPSVIYICGRKEGDGTYSGALFTTSDGGNTWTDISNAVETERYLIFTSVVIDPTDDGRIYVGGNYFYRGTRTGRNSDLSWTRSPITFYIYSLGIDPIDPSRIYMGMYESLAISTNYGVSWNLRSDTIKSSAGHIAVAPADPSKVYVSSYAGFYKSSDFGANWDTAHEGIYAGRINAMAVDPRMILIQKDGNLVSYGRGRGNVIWEDVVTPPSCGQVSDILVNPDNPNIVLVIEGYG